MMLRHEADLQVPRRPTVTASATGSLSSTGKVAVLSTRWTTAWAPIVWIAIS